MKPISASINHLLSAYMGQDMQQLQQIQQLRSQDADIRLRASRVNTGKIPQENAAHVNYRYEIGADGQRYVTKAEIRYLDNASIQPDAKNNAPADAQREQSRNQQPQSMADISPPSVTIDSLFMMALRESLQTGAVLSDVAPDAGQLRTIDVSVRQHEAAHFRAASGLATQPHYELIQADDGRYYAVAGEVKVRTSAGVSPDQSARQLSTLALAATSPADASAQDMLAARSFYQKAAEVYNAQRYMHNDVLFQLSA